MNATTIAAFKSTKQKVVEYPVFAWGIVSIVTGLIFLTCGWNKLFAIACVSLTLSVLTYFKCWEEGKRTISWAVLSALAVAICYMSFDYYMWSDWITTAIAVVSLACAILAYNGNLGWAAKGFGNGLLAVITFLFTNLSKLVEGAITGNWWCVFILGLMLVPIYWLSNEKDVWFWIAGFGIVMVSSAIIRGVFFLKNDTPEAKKLRQEAKATEAKIEAEKKALEFQKRKLELESENNNKDRAYQLTVLETKIKEKDRDIEVIRTEHADKIKTLEEQQKALRLLREEREARRIDEAEYKAGYSKIFGIVPKKK